MAENVANIVEDKKQSSRKLKRPWVKWNNLDYKVFVSSTAKRNQQAKDKMKIRQKFTNVLS